MATKFEQIGDKLNRDAEALEAEMKRLRHEAALASENTRTAIEAKMGRVKEKAQALRDQVEAAMEDLDRQPDPHLAVLEAQMNYTSDAQKAKIQAEIQEGLAETKAQNEKAKAKLEQANSHIKKALGL